MKILKESQKLISYKHLKKFLKYDKKTGLFVWKKSPNKRIKVGAIAGTLTNGYNVIRINGKFYRAGRLAFFYVKKYWPKNIIDHKTRIRNDDRWKNLRDSSFSMNMINIEISKKNKSGVKGVFYSEERKRFRVSISFNNKQYFLGHFKDFEEASLHRFAAEQCLDWNVREVQQ